MGRQTGSLTAPRARRPLTRRLSLTASSRDGAPARRTLEGDAMTRTGLPGWFRLRAGALSALVLCSTLFCAPPSWARQSTPPAIAIDGQVRDRSGAVLVGVTVEAVAAGRIVGATATGDDGRYRLEVPGGTPFELRVRRDGF